MEIILLVAILFLVVSVVVLAILLLRVNKKLSGKDNNDSLVFLQNQLNELSRTLDSKLSESSKSMNESVKTQFSESQKLIRDFTNDLKSITKEITEVKETNKQVFTITESLENLEKVLKNQKQRGSLGEAGLELILSNVLPPDAYQLQYGFSNGDIADAVIKTKEGIICIDAKFSLDNYNRIIAEEDNTKREALEKEFRNDLKQRIEETAKYIKPEEGTLPFAIMYIPAEGIYYDLLINQVGSVKVNTRSLIEYAYRDKNVIIVSPTTFVAYLQTILQGFRAFKIEESAKKIGKRVEELRRHLLAYEEHHNKLGNTLGTAVNHFNKSDKSFRMIDKDVLRISGEGLDHEVLNIPKPDQDEE
ncbi:MAG: DNA recombination protein RmuC [Candidatus Campbellbacteria bacterium]|nr:DNA recombination protein RmuC [Candidatus Campbellbacteria bacterium]